MVHRRWTLGEGEALVSVLKIDCGKVLREISNFIENEVSPELRQRMQAHFAECAHCLAVLDGTTNVIRLVGDGEVFEIPAGFSQRLAARIRQLGPDAG